MIKILFFFSSIMLVQTLQAQIGNDTSVNKPIKNSLTTVQQKYKKHVTVIDEDLVFSKTEIEAEFSGGVTAWKQYLQNNLNMGIMDQNKLPKGTYTVLVRFIVAKDGTISNINPLTKNGFGLEEEAIRVIKISPKWTPATQNGYIVRAYKTQHFTFIMSED
jgi:periplasmic protein TonB